MLNTDSIDWKRQLIYLCGLLFILDALYSAYYFFPELETGVINFAVLWVDAVALIASSLIMGLFNLSIKEGKLNYSKIQYMQKFQEGQEHIIQTFAEISEAKSGETGQHVKRVADVYDALSSRRAYKDPWTPTDARKEIIENEGTQFAPEVVAAFKEVYEGIEDIRLRYQDNL